MILAERVEHKKTNFSIKDIMSTKKKKVRKSLSFCCDWEDCQSTFQLSLEMNSHLEEKHLKQFCTVNDKFICLWSMCDFQAKCRNEFERHVYYHGYHAQLLTVGKYECERHHDLPKCTLEANVCEKVPELKKDYRCDWDSCKRTFVSVIEFQDHVFRHISYEHETQKTAEINSPELTCRWNLCKKKFKGKYRLSEHCRMHSDKKEIACFQCGDTFRTKTSLFDHLRRQPGNNTQKYQCAQCFKYFSTEKLLRLHVIKHVNCYKCTMCDMSCTSASALTLHIRYRHLKDKPFKCTHCNHRCVREGDLVKHVQFKHAHELHRCDQPGCNYAVRTYNYLRRHYIEVHANNPFIYVCHCCESMFKCSKSLSKHLIKRHDIQLPSGHKRFTYRTDAQGFYRLETMRIESLEVSKQILTPNPLEPTDATEDSSNCERISPKDEENECIVISSNIAGNQAIGELIISFQGMDES